MSIFKGSILIVDRDESTRRMLLYTLARECYYCVVASSGQDALDKSTRHNFDVVLLDAMMPSAPGLEMLPRLVERCPDTQFIMVESTIDREAVEESMRLGAYDYVTKPLNMRDIVSRVEGAMATKRITLAKGQLGA